MSDQLSAQMGELRRQRTELEQSVTRIGEAFASGLDRNALLEIVAETAELGVRGRARADPRSPAARNRRPRSASRSRGGAGGGARRRARGDSQGRDGGGAGGGLRSRSRSRSRPASRGAAATGAGSALAGAAMTSSAAAGHSRRASARCFRYLIGQAAASIENVELHEMVAEQAVTDELTGLPNNRRFRRWIATETARAERFGHDLSLLMLDIDDFKKVNDTYGHLQGDEVLRSIGRVLREESRGIDEPARYGGEEFAIGLPETDIERRFRVRRARAGADRGDRDPDDRRRRLDDGDDEHRRGDRRAHRNRGPGARGCRRPGAIPGEARGQEPHRKGASGAGRGRREERSEPRRYVARAEPGVPRRSSRFP